MEYALLKTCQKFALEQDNYLPAKNAEKYLSLKYLQ